MKKIYTISLITLAAITGLMALVVMQPVVHAQSTPVSKLQMSGYSQTVINVKFDESAGITLSDGQFVSKNGKNISAINRATNMLITEKKERLFKGSADKISQQRQALQKSAKRTLPNLNDYFRVTLRKGQNIDKVVSQLKKSPYVLEAYAAPLPAPTPVAPDYSGGQTYFGAAPDGMNIGIANSQPGITGSNVKVADLEYAWNTAHEDLGDTRASDALLANGIPSNPFNDNNHGTAVAGVLSGDANGFGVNGVAHDSQLHLVNTYSEDRGWDIPNAIYLAMQNMGVGDVILIEQQISGPAGRYVPVEWEPAVYDAIKIAVASGIHVVEAAGNGREDLDNPIYGSRFPAGKEDSGAIIVGAGSACAGSTPRTRLAFSTFGSRVNVQGYGECVVTTGYGTLYSAEGQNAFYANGFSGTSSASATVTGVVAALSSSYEEQTGVNISPAMLRALLVQTGTPQDRSVLGKIGPLPNMTAALDAMMNGAFVDTDDPTTPLNVTATSVNETQVALSWTPSSDETDVAYYDVYRDGVLVASTIYSSYTDTALTPGTTYVYTVRAEDPAGHVSSASLPLSVTTVMLDTIPPSAVTELTATALSPSTVDLSWAPSTDNVGAVSYQIQRNGNTIAEVSTPYFTDSGLTEQTRYSYYVRAKDAANNYGNGALIYVTTLQAPDTTAPVATITTPLQGATIGNSVVISVKATDNKTVTKLELYIDGLLKASNTNSTALSYTWDSRKASRGTHTITVKAYDAAGNIGQASITVQK